MNDTESALRGAAAKPPRYMHYIQDVHFFVEIKISAQ